MMHYSRLCVLGISLIATSAGYLHAVESADAVQEINTMLYDASMSQAVMVQNTAVGGAANHEQQVSRVDYDRVNGKTALKFAGIANADVANKDINAATMLPSDTLVIARSDKQMVALTTHAYEGQTLATSVALKTGNGADANGILAVAGDNQHFLAPVLGQKAANFPTATAGIASLRVDASGLACEQEQIGGVDKAFKVSNGSADNDATSVSLAKNKDATNSTSVVSMVWDEHLRGAYLGATVQASKGAQATSLVLAKYVEDDAAPLGEKLDARAALNTSWAPGFDWSGFDNGQNLSVLTNNNKGFVSAQKVAVMHTSTGKDYVIVNGGGVDAGQINQHVYALPVMPKTSPLAGVIAQTDGWNEFKVISAAAQQKHEATDYSVLVGVKAERIKSDMAGILTGLAAYDDTLYASFAGARNTDTNDEAGVVSSRALFDEYGCIRAWTYWKYEAFIGSKVKAFCIDKRTGQPQAAVTKKAYAQQWAQGAVQRLNTSLADLLGDDFGVLGMVTFDPSTPSFKQRNNVKAPGAITHQPQCSCMVATGYGKVAFIVTGEHDGSKFVPTANFTGKVKVYGDDPALQALGPVVTADMSRPFWAAGGVGAVANNGWLLVGGQGGVAALRVPGDGAVADAGKGWDALPNGNVKTLAHFTKFNGAGPDFTFAQVKTSLPDAHNFAHTRKIIATQNVAYIMTRTAVYRLALTAANLKGDHETAELDGTQVKLIASITTSRSAKGAAIGANGDEFYDMMMVDNTFNEGKLLLASSTGMWVSAAPAGQGVNSGGVDADRIVWKHPYDKHGIDDAFSSGAALMFECVSGAEGGMFMAADRSMTMSGAWDGNLYVVALDPSSTYMNVYRFNVQNGTVRAICEYYTEGNKPISKDNNTDYFYRIGRVDHAFDGMRFFQDFSNMYIPAQHMAAHGVLGDAMPLYQAVDPEDYVHAGEPHSAINLNCDLTMGAQFTQLIQDPGSGSRYVYGQAGVRCLE